MERLHRTPFLLVLTALSGLAMLAPAIHAYGARDLITARAFLYSAVLVLILTGLLTIATGHMTVRRQGRSQLISLVAVFAVLPAILALPMVEAVPTASRLNMYVEMVSSLTTTGLTLFEPQHLPDSLHLWRAIVGWAGGFFVWVTAVALLAPLNLGGFEVSSAAEVGAGARGTMTQIDRIADPGERLRRFASRLAPLYGGLTLCLWVALVMAGEDAFVAACHAMSTLATSGISPIGGVEFTQSGLFGEAVILLFLVFALSRVTFSSDERAEGWRSIGRDPELRIGLAIVLILPVLLFLRHWVGAFEDDSEVTLAEGLAGLWGGVFTVAGFLTTTGWESEVWSEAQAWSGLETPGLLLMGLALFGGGVATTAGGVKLLRVYALYKHGLRELEKLVQPSSVGGSGAAARRFRRQGAYVAWIFFMLFALSIALVMTVLSLLGVAFEDALVLTIATLSTTGPIAEVAREGALSVGTLGPWAKSVLVAAMVLGRLETLAIIALLNPEFWR